MHYEHSPRRRGRRGPRGTPAPTAPGTQPAEPPPEKTARPTKAGRLPRPRTGPEDARTRTGSRAVRGGGPSARGGASARPGGEASRPGPLPKHEEPKPPGLLKTCFQIIHVVKRKHKPRQPQRRPRGRKKLRGHGQEVRRRTEQASPAPRQEQERRDSASQGRAGSSRGQDNSRT